MKNGWGKAVLATVGVCAGGVGTSGQAAAQDALPNRAQIEQNIPKQDLPKSQVRVDSGSALTAAPCALEESDVKVSVTTLALELSPIRVNGVHPGIIGNSPFWSAKPEGVLSAYESRTPGGALATMEDVVGATRFLLDNRGVSATNLYVDRGWRIT